MSREIFRGIIDGIVVDRVVRDGDFSMPALHLHPEFEVYYLLEGSRYYFIENKTYLVNKGNLVIVNTMQVHRTSLHVDALHDRILIEMTSEPFSVFFESVSGMTLQDFFATHEGVFEFDEDGQKYIEGLLFSIIDELKNQLFGYQSMAMMKIAEALIFVMRCKAGKYTLSSALESNVSKHKRVHEITAYILENYNNVKSLDDVSKRFFLNKSYLCRIFREVTGSTVQDYINVICIKKAQKLLENSDMRVSEISEFLGYGSLTYFERMFKKFTETTPLKYRKKIRLITSKVRERQNEKGVHSPQNPE